MRRRAQLLGMEPTGELAGHERLAQLRSSSRILAQIVATIQPSASSLPLDQRLVVHNLFALGLFRRPFNILRVTSLLATSVETSGR